ncbi:FAD-binding oxidoreductase [Streptomyces phaeofaciens JCM 4814]|uniref:FAD-binding protein n=1 Tax=Streptomyces phaeofaciens TaxID=68254 RepID=A0A918HR86_9ACTN|nr:FAD-binding oxidoreductase [Streptomyces phaeofaciens]GGT96742.1 FAD-binding protein [Streptomyces phaeofaciens]
MLDIIRPGDPRYADVQHVYTTTGAPAAVLQPRTTDEVVQALGFARDTGGPLSLRSGGHGISSVSTNERGTVIDLSRLSTIERVRPDARLVRVGPGARWGEVAATLHPWGLAISSGDSGDVGVGGLATTGGIGLMGRAHGLTIDHITAAEMVTADGRVLHLDAQREPDLFWAVRGGGANMGIVTSLEFRADPVPVVARATLQYRIERLAPFLQAWGETVEAAPRKISAFLYLMGGGFALATVVYAGDDPAAAEAALTPFLQVAPTVGHQAQVVPYAAVVAATHAPHRGQQSGRTHTGLAVHLDQDLSERLESLDLAGFGQLLQIRSVGGAINDVPADATAYAHRHQNFSITAVAPSSSRAFDEAWAAVHPSLDGLYLSFESEFTPQRLTEAFPGATLQRLRDIKKQVDPDNVFRQNFPVVGFPDVTHRP